MKQRQRRKLARLSPYAWAFGARQTRRFLLTSTGQLDTDYQRWMRDLLITAHGLGRLADAAQGARQPGKSWVQAQDMARFLAGNQTAELMVLPPLRGINPMRLILDDIGTIGGAQ